MCGVHHELLETFVCFFLQVKLTQGNLTFMPTQDSVASQQELIVASGFCTR